MMHTISETLILFGNSLELMLGLKATFALILGLSIVCLARSSRASLRHMVLTAMFGVLLIMPLGLMLMPTLRIQIKSPGTISPTPMAPQNQSTGTPTEGQQISTTANKNLTVSSPLAFLRAAWALGVVVFLTSFGVGLWRLHRMRRCGLPWLEARDMLGKLAPVSTRRRIDVLLHDDLNVPVTCGLLRPAIILPSEAKTWSELDLERVFLHELEHINRLDWPVHILTRVTCAIYWCHPLVWVAWRQLCLAAERACDDVVVLQSEKAAYAEQLVGLARRLSNAFPPPVLSMANRSYLSIRVAAILDGNQSRGRAGIAASVAAVAIAAAIVLGIAPMRVVSSQVAQPQQAANEKSGSGRQPSRLDRALVEASEEGDIAEMTKLLDAGADVNAAVVGDGSPLIVASREGHIAAVKFLLDRGADPNLGVPGDGNAIIMAAREGHEEVVQLLLDRGANVDGIVTGDENALIQASGAGHLTIVKLLVSHGADVNKRVWSGDPNGEWRTPLSVARRKNNQAVVDFLVSAGARE